MKPNLHCNQCDFITSDAKEGMQHVRTNQTHTVTGEGAIEGTTLTIRVEVGDDDV